MKDCTWEPAANLPEDTITEFNSNMDKALWLVTKCPICNMAYNSERALRQHLTNKHPDVGKEAQCPICTKNFFDLWQHVLKTHRKRSYKNCVPKIPLIICFII
jgi:hypothetical protein